MTAAIFGDEPAPEEIDLDRPRDISSPSTRTDLVFRAVLYAAGIAVLLIVGLIAVFLVTKASGALSRAGFGFFTTKTWIPAQAHKFGVGSLLLNGIYIAVIAMVFAVPIGLGTALFIAEYAPPWLKRPMIALVDLMAAVPSIIYALFGAFFLQYKFAGTARWMSEHLGFIPIFKVPGDHSPSAFGTSTFDAALIVSLMVVPIIASISREVFTRAPAGEREGAYALGSSRWDMVRTVVLPYGRGGMIGAVMLGFGRAMGETIAIALIISPTYDIVTHPLENHGLSIAALIALRASESTPDAINALMAAGLVLFVVTLVVNALASVVISRSRSGADNL